MTHDYRYTEITGCSCCGKSTIFHTEGGYISGGDISGCPIPSVLVRFLFFLVGMGYLIRYLGKLCWIISKCKASGLTSPQKASALRNCIEKFGCYFLFKNDSKIIDEGISHLPFILQLSSVDIIEFLDEFEKELRMIKINMMSSPSEEELVNRLLARGHKKVVDKESAISFARKNYQISKDYFSALSSLGEGNVKFI